MKSSIVQYTGSYQDLGMPEHVIRYHEKRLNACLSELQNIERKGDKFVFTYVFYSVEPPKKITKLQMEKQFRNIQPDLEMRPPGVTIAYENREVIIYGDVQSAGVREKVDAYLAAHRLQEICAPFYDRKEEREQPGGSYASLQKALFFCQKKRCPLIFTSIHEQIRDIRFLNLLEDSVVEFQCIDFSWFFRKNLSLFKAAALYDKMR